jgi:hypothetical protein
MKRFIGSLVFFVSASAWAIAPGIYDDPTDLWSNPDESGWGLNIVRQNTTLFLTMFVYGEDGKPTWFSGSATEYKELGIGLYETWEGPLYRTTGPYFGGAFNPALMHYEEVGRVKFFMKGLDGGEINYTVNGVFVAKALRRLTMRYADIAGSYAGAVSRSTGAGGGCRNMQTGDESVRITISQSTTRDPSASSVVMQTDGNWTCIYSGAYTQYGRIGQLSGIASCNDGFVGTFGASDIEVTASSIGGEIIVGDGHGSTCWVGNFGGVRRQATP